MARNALSDATSHQVPYLLEDTYLFERLQKLASKIEEPDSHEVVVEEKQNSKGNDRYSKYSIYIDQLNNSITKYETILSETEAVNDALLQVVDKFDTIALTTKEFLESTHELHKEYTSLKALHDIIPQHLKYYKQLDPIIRRLNHASQPSIVRKDSFKSMLLNIDQSLIYLEEHQSDKEAEAYRIKFKRCLVRSCELISNYLSGVLKHAETEIAERISKLSDSSNTAAREALLYNKFALSGEDYQIQVSEIVSRIQRVELDRYKNELEAILNDCYSKYFQTRKRLLQPMLTEFISKIDNEKDANLPHFIQHCKRFLQELCIDEYRLFIKFFPEEPGKNHVNNWFLQLCDPLYDICRIRILKETSISALCESVSIFRQYYEFEEGSEEYLKQFREVLFDKVFEDVLQKLQTRLILRVQIYVEQNIIKYTPTKEVFMITSRKKQLKEATAAVVATNLQQDPIVKSFFESRASTHLHGLITDTDMLSQDISSVISKYEAYYPPIVRAIALLSKIYEMVNSVVFDDLAHHIVHDCILSLRKAHNVLSITDGTSNNKLNSYLAYFKNLFLLREELQNFNIQYTVNETYLDFSAMESFFNSIREGAQWRPKDSSILTLARELVPKVVNNMVDARTELMQELRNTIKDFTEETAKDIVGDTLNIPDFKDSEQLVSNNVLLRKNIEERLSRIYELLKDSVDDPEIVAHLVEAIQEVITQSYARFYEAISEKAEQGELEKAHVSEIMYVDVFSDFFNNSINKLTNK